MGCDIHLYVEKRESGRWASADAWHDDPDQPGSKTVYKWGPGLTREAGPIYSSRNYDLFAILADVRNGRGFAGCDTGDGFAPISPPRGVPEDASPEYIQEVEGWGGDDHSHSYLTVAEIMAYDWTRTTAKRGVVSPREFARFHLTGRPDSWSGDIVGGGVRLISNDEMLALIKNGRENFAWKDYHAMDDGAPIASYYTQISWQVKYYEVASEFLSETLPQLWRLGTPEDVRIVFFFDN